MRFHWKRAASLLLLGGIAIFAAACSSSESTPVPEITPGPTEVTEEIVAASVDGVLFDIKLTGSVHDNDADGSFRDEITVLAPDAVEFQGHFPEADGDLLIVSCFTEQCRTGERSATFTVRYWTIAE